MNQPLLHPRTKLQLENYLNTPAHALLLKGQPEIGKRYIASWISEELATPIIVISTEPKKSAITIDQIRELYRLTRTGEPLTILIQDAHNMGIPAQNAFLKLLEEPPENVKFILTVSSQHTALLPTIISRCVVIDVIPPSTHDLLEVAQHSAALPVHSIKALLHTTEGLPAAFLKTAADEDRYAQHLDTVSQAKDFYQTSRLERHKILINHAYDKIWALRLLNTLQVILRTLLKKNAGAPITIRKLVHQSEVLEKTASALLYTTGNPKIHLTRLVEEL